MAGVGVGHLQRIWQDVFRVAGAVQETCSSELFGGQGADFLRRVAFWSIRSSGLLRLRDGCSTSYDLVSLFRWRSTLDTWTGKIARRTRPWALHSTFEFWRKSRWMALFLMLSPSKNEEVSQNCFDFALVNFENWEVSLLSPQLKPQLKPGFVRSVSFLCKCYLLAVELSRWKDEELDRWMGKMLRYLNG